MRLFDAEIPELVRSQKKDEEYIDELNGSITSLAQRFLKSPQVIRWQKELVLFGPLAYYAVTTLSGLQTLGEEYVGLIEAVHTSNGRLAVPSAIRRLLFVTLQLLGPYISEALLSKARRTLVNAVPTSANREHWIRIIDSFRQGFIPAVQRLHLAVFYIGGHYYQLSKRVTNVRYKSLHTQSRIWNTYAWFRWLGYLSIIQLFSSSIFWAVAELKNFRQNGLQKRDDKYSPTTNCGLSSNFRCQLCLDEGRPVACTPCGHPFCWNCLLEHVTENNNCPLCRSEVSPSRVIPLMNI